MQTKTKGAASTARTSKPIKRKFGEIPGMEIIDGYYMAGSDYVRAVGFHKGRLALFDGEAFKPLTLREAVRQLQEIVRDGERLSLEFADWTELARVKFYGMVAAAIK